jgi:hypothetical protein
VIDSLFQSGAWAAARSAGIRAAGDRWGQARHGAIPLNQCGFIEEFVSPAGDIAGEAPYHSPFFVFRLFSS